MKKDNHMEFNAAQELLMSICKKFAEKEQSRSFNSIFSKSDKQVAVELIKEFKNCNSTPELIIKLAQYDSNKNVFESLRDAVVLKILPTSPKKIEEVGIEIARAHLVQASRGYASAYSTIVPNINAAKNQFFAQYVRDAKSTPVLTPLELS